MDWRSYKPLLLPRIPNLSDITVYEAHGGYAQFRRALKEMTPQAVIEEVKAANIRGRGGAGFNAGLKWTFMPPKKEGVPLPRRQRRRIRTRHLQRPSHLGV